MLLLALKCTFVEVGQLIIHDQAFVPFYPGVPEDNTKTYYEYMWPLSPCIWLRLLRGHTKNMLWFKSCVPQLRTHIVCVTQKSAISILNKLIFFFSRFLVRTRSALATHRVSHQTTFLGGWPLRSRSPPRSPLPHWRKPRQSQVWPLLLCLKRIFWADTALFKGPQPEGSQALKY